MSEEELEGELQSKAEDESQDQEEEPKQEEVQSRTPRDRKDQCLVYLVPKSYLPQMRQWEDMGVNSDDMELQEKEDHYKVSLYNMGLLNVHGIGDILEKGHGVQVEQEKRKKAEKERKEKK